MTDPLDELLESLIEEQGLAADPNEVLEDLADADPAGLTYGGDDPDSDRETFQNLPAIDLPDAPLTLEQRGAQRRHVRDLQRLLAVFLKAGKTLRLYSEKHRFFAGFADEFMTRLNNEFGAADAITFEITPTCINWDGHVVFENPEQRENLAFKLYRDGVRLLQFRRGVTPDEVREFVTLVAREVDAGHRAGGSKDLSVLFWEADFKHIHIAVAETFIEYTEEAQRVLQDLEFDVQYVQGSFRVAEGLTLTADYEPAAYDADSPWDEPISDFGAEEEALWGTGRMEEAPGGGPGGGGGAGEAGSGGDAAEDGDEEEEDIRLPNVVAAATDEGAIQRIREELFGMEDPYASFEEVGVILGEVVLTIDDPSELALFLRHLDEAISPLLATASIGPLNSILRRLSLIGRAALDAEDVLGSIIQQFFVNVCQEERLELLARAIDQDWSDNWAGEVFTFVSLQSPNSIGELLGFLGRLYTLGARRVVTDALILLAGRRPAPFLNVLRSPNWRLAADAAHALGRIGDPTAVDQIAGAFERKEHHLRVEILKAIGPYQSPRLQDLVLGALEDEHEDVRLAALRYLAVYRIKDAVPIITGIMGSKEFTKRSFEERRGWYITLGTIAGPQIFMAFRRRAEPARGTAVVSEDVHLALLGIRSIRTPEAGDWLKLFEREAQGDLRLLVRKLLQQRKGA